MPYSDDQQQNRVEMILRGNMDEAGVVSKELRRLQNALAYALAVTAASMHPEYARGVKQMAYLLTHDMTPNVGGNPRERSAAK